MGQTYKFGRGTWATKEGSTLAYNDEGNNYKPLPFSFERDSIATRVNKEGLIEVVGKDIPRIDYTDSADGVLLLENSATNLYSYSNKSSEWLKTNWTTTDNYAISPDGTQNAFRAVSLNTSGILYQTATGSSGVNTLSVYAKSNTSTNQKFRFFGNGNTLTSDDFTVTNEWKRIEFSYTYSSVTAGIKGASNELSDILFFGFQHEVNDFATSYIPTSGSSVPRAAETANGSGNSEVFNDSEGVLFADISALDSESTNKMITISNGSNSTRILIRYVGTTLLAQLRISGANQYEFFYDPTNIKDNFKIAFKYKANDFNFFVNGFELDSSNSGSTFSDGTLTELAFDDGGGGNDFYGKTKELGYYDTALTDEELEYITSYRSLNELVTELNLNTL
jgi:hypothetical protein